MTELVLFGVHGSFRTLQPGRRQVNLFPSRKRGHSRKPDELYQIIEQCSPGPYLELFARFGRHGWEQWGNEAPDAGEEAAEPEAHATPSSRSLRDYAQGAIKSVEERETETCAEV